MWSGTFDQCDDSLVVVITRRTDLADKAPHQLVVRRARDRRVFDVGAERHGANKIKFERRFIDHRFPVPAHGIQRR